MKLHLMSLRNLLNHKTHTLTNNQKANIYAIITILFWSTVATAFKIGLMTLSPAQLIFIASLTTLVILFILLCITKKIQLLIQLSLTDVMYSAILGFLNPFLYYLIIFKSYSLLPAQVAQPINMIWPIVLVLLSIPLLKQKIRWKSIVALAISFSGVFLISTQGGFNNISKSNPLGIALGLSSAIFWSLFWILNVRSKLDELIKLFLNFIFGTMFLIIFLLIFDEINFKLNKSLFAGIYIGTFEIGISFVLWMKALSLTSNNARIANFIYIAPFISLIFIHFILGEQIFLTTILGIIFIISGIVFQQTERINKE